MPPLHCTGFDLLCRIVMLQDVVPDVCHDHGDSPTPRSSSSLKRQPVKPASVDQAAAAFVRPASKAATRPAPPDPADPSPPSCIKETFTLPPVIRKEELQMVSCLLCGPQAAATTVQAAKCISACMFMQGHCNLQ
jgi:hypothetical protein